MEKNDDFEMKPLTAGLGFQKRHISLKEHMAKSGIATQNLRKNLPQLPPEEMTGAVQPRSAKEIINELHAALEPINNKKHNVKLTEVLPREIDPIKSPHRPTPDISPIENVDFQIPDKSLNDSAGVRRGAHDNLVPPLKPIPVSLSAMALDSAIVLAFSLVFVVSLVMVTGVDVISVLSQSKSEFATQLSLFVLYLAVYEMYVIISRSFFGFTMAEWTFDLQLGKDEQIQSSTYPLLVLWRSTITFLTGIVVLPLLSLLLNRDLAAQLTGLQLFKKNI